MEEEFYQSCRNGDIDKINKIILYLKTSNRTSYSNILNKGMEILCFNGHFEIIKRLSENRHNFYGFRGGLILIALINNNDEIANWLVDKGYTCSGNDFSSCCSEYDLDLIQKYYSLSLDKTISKTIFDTQHIIDGFINACENGNFNVAQWLYEIEKDKIINNFDKNRSMKILKKCSDKANGKKVINWLLTLDIHNYTHDVIYRKLLEYCLEFVQSKISNWMIYESSYYTCTWIYSECIHKNMDLYDECLFYRTIIEKHKENYVIEVLSKLEYHYISKDPLFDKNIFEMEIWSYIFDVMKKN